MRMYILLQVLLVIFIINIVVVVAVSAATSTSTKFPHYTRRWSATSSSNGYFPRISSSSKTSIMNEHPTSADCEENYFEQPIDHFSFYKEDSSFGKMWKQRYFICGKQDWSYSENKNGPFFFYVGNEADVTLYVNNSGIMWENHKKFGALMIFGEHRYYGKSLPFGEKKSSDMKQFLSAEQALADNARLLTYLKSVLKVQENTPIIAFGGSYGGMLATWFRIKYPHIIQGAIAGSAPILDFIGISDDFNPNFFYDTLTKDASPEGGSNKYCVANVKRAWDIIFKTFYSVNGPSKIQEIFKLCEKPENENDIWNLFYYIQSGWSYMGMGNYPYKSSYILNGNGELPAYPVRVACEYLNFESIDDNTDDEYLLTSVHNAISVYYNYSQSVECVETTGAPNKESKIVEDLWNYQYCTEMFMPMSSNGKTDMFWSSPWNASAASQECLDQFGIVPKQLWTSTKYGGNHLSTTSNIIFSQGEYDPWRDGGLKKNISENSIFSIVIEGGAHHLDFMWSNPEDPPSVIQAREFEMEHVSKWIDEYHNKKDSNDPFKRLNHVSKTS